MQKETLDKLRQYIDLAATHSSLSVRFPLGRWPEHEMRREQLWQEFVEAVQAEEYVPDDARLDQAFVDLMERHAGGTS